MQTLLGLGLLHELWVSAEPAGYARHITTDPLPGRAAPKHILMTPAWLDKQVSNQCTEAEARTLGLPNLRRLAAGALQDIPDLRRSARLGLRDVQHRLVRLFNPAHQPFIPPLANVIPSSVCDPHSAPRKIPAGIQQLIDFLQPGGQVRTSATASATPATRSRSRTAASATTPARPCQGALCAGNGDCGGGVCVATIYDPLNP